MSGLRQRRVEPEAMDDPALEVGRHLAALRGLARINRVSRAAAALWRAMDPDLRRRASSGPASLRSDRQAPRVVDLACGGGDVTVALAVKARRAGVALRLTGLDVSGVALDHARRSARAAGVDIAFERRDVCREPLAGRYDVAISSLFLHHLDEAAAAAVLGRMRDAADVVLISDLRRSRTAYAVAWVGTRLLTRSAVVHVDGPQSVAAGWTAAELRALAERAGLRGAAVRRQFPGRLLLQWRRDTRVLYSPPSGHSPGLRARLKSPSAEAAGAA